MDKVEKIKAIRPQIIVTDTVERPYYQILYYDTSDKTWYIGYSSYCLENVVKWKQECFEVVGEIEDMEIVEHGHWVKTDRGIRVKNENTGQPMKVYYCDCSCCGWHTGHQGIGFKYCPQCGAKMEETMVGRNENA